jgi:hypothetical protein
MFDFDLSQLALRKLSAGRGAFPHPIDDMLRMIVNRPLPANGFASSAEGEGFLYASPNLQPRKLGCKER